MLARSRAVFRRVKIGTSQLFSVAKPRKIHHNISDAGA